MAIILIELVGYAIKHSVAKQESQEVQENVAEEIILFKHQEHEENIDEDYEHDHFVGIERNEMKNLTVKEVVDLWEIDAKIFLLEIIDDLI